ncbi:MAG: hypothetical protein V2A69_04440 [Pseudomonadota bacterium]
MPEEKIRIYKIVYYQFLTLLRMGFLPGSSPPLGNLLGIFQRRDLPVRFFTSDVSPKGALALNLGVDLLAEEIVEALIDELCGLDNYHDLTLTSQTSMVMIYGPHFGEMPGIAGLTLSTLTRYGITPLALSASSSSISCLFPAVQFKSALESLNTIFEPPAPYFSREDY